MIKPCFGGSAIVQSLDSIGVIDQETDLDALVDSVDVLVVEFEADGLEALLETNLDAMFCASIEEK